MSETNEPASIPVVFYHSPGGAEPVREWLKKLDPLDRRAVGQDLQRVQFRWPIGMPLCKSLKDGLWEIRTSLAKGRIARVLFCAHDGRLVLLNGFIKKTQKAPSGELELARKRQSEVMTWKPTRSSDRP
jgi:phage-related protein